MLEKIITAIIALALGFVGVASYHAWEDRGCDMRGCSEPVFVYWTSNPEGNPIIMERLCDMHWKQFHDAPAILPETTLDLPE